MMETICILFFYACMYYLGRYVGYREGLAQTVEWSKLLEYEIKRAYELDERTDEEIEQSSCYKGENLC